MRQALLEEVEKTILPEPLCWFVSPRCVIPGVGIMMSGGEKVFPVRRKDGTPTSGVIMYLEHIRGPEKFGIEFGCLDSREEMERKIADAVRQMMEWLDAGA